MSEARRIELGPVAARTGGLDLVLVSPNDPEAMLRHTDECRDRGIPFAADPSQQLARMDGEEVRRLVDGAAYLFTNEYERALCEEKTGWSGDEILDRVAVRITTLGSKGVAIDRKGEEGVHVPAAPVAQFVDPTGGGDAFRGGFLTALAWELPLERAAQVGHVIAAYVLETDGPQEYTLSKKAFLDRLGTTYGATAAAEVEPHLDSPRP
jgi:adenosine kinase